jgi:hypothetical protein
VEIMAIVDALFEQDAFAAHAPKRQNRRELPIT